MRAVYHVAGADGVPIRTLQTAERLPEERVFLTMITSPANQHISALRALQQPKGREAAGAFLLEGPHLLDAAFDADVRPLSLVFDPDTLGRTPAGRQLLGRIEEARDSGIPAYEATAQALERAADTRTPQGVVAAIAREDVSPEKVRARRRGRARPLIVVLDALADPGNEGTILRAALAADVDEVLLAPGSADPFSPKVVRAGSGAHFHIPIRTGLSWDEIAERLRGAPAVRQVLLAEAEARTPYDAVDMTRRTAIIIGNEAHGPSTQAARLATTPVRIPMWNKVESLNAAVAASVILFEAARQRRAKEAEKERSDAADERDDG